MQRMWTRFRRAWVAYGYGAAAFGGGIGGLAATAVFAALLEIARSGALDVVVPVGAWFGLACAPAFGAWWRLSRGALARSELRS